MPHEVGKPRKILFYVGVIGLTLTDFPLDIFSVDSNPVSADVINSLTITAFEFSGYYTALYVPDVPGFYSLAMRNAANNVTVIDGIDIDEANQSVNLSQDFGGTDALKVTQVDTPDEFMLFVIDSNDWQVGRTSPNFAQASTQLDSDGNWSATPLVLSPGKYHIVIMNDFGVVKVIRPNLVLKV